MGVSYSLHVPCEHATGECLTSIVASILGGESVRRMGKKIFVGRLPQEATTDDLHQHFGRFGRILDAYIPKVKWLVF